MSVKKSLFIPFLLISFAGIAQKLPVVQQSSVRAPANIKIDGKATEWGNKFQANNHSTDIYYTLSNDDAHLYLTVQAIYPDVIKRILNGGLTLAINKNGKKNDPNCMSVTYPSFDKNNTFVVNFKIKPTIIVGNPASVMQADSFMNANNKRMKNKSKLIRTDGIKDLDTLISVYNEDGIKAAALFDNKMVYTWEISIDMKLLGITVNSLKFTYHLTINEVTQHGIEIKKGNDGNILSINISKGAQVGQSATDFWGEYTLAKK